MIPVFSSTDLKTIDRETIRKHYASSFDLMEVAVHALLDKLMMHVQSLETIDIICGTGNNGGDGMLLATYLRLLQKKIIVWVVHGKESADFIQAKKKAEEAGIAIRVLDALRGDEWRDSECVIDALFGYGLNREVEGLYKHVIEQINASQAYKISLDMPSGMLCDAYSKTSVQADVTYTFHFPKLSFLLPDTGERVGNFSIVQLPLDEETIKACAPSYFLLEKNDIAQKIKRRKKFSHKGTYGHALLITGSYGKVGASVLSARAALRTGVGLLTIHAPACGVAILQTSVPEAMVEADDNEKFFTHCADTSRYQAIGIGSGIGTDKKTADGLWALCARAQPLVLDADALNIFAQHPDKWNNIPQHSILTPHVRELERWIGKCADGFERLEKAKKLAQQLNVFIVLKGAHTAIIQPSGQVFFNATGNPYMATGGSGDVLTGMLTALMAQGYTPLEAASIGVYVHGLAGDLAHTEKYFLTAHDSIDNIGKAMREVLLSHE